MPSNIMLSKIVGNKWLNTAYKTALLAILFFAPTKNTLALNEHEKLWLGINVNKPFSTDNKWLYTVFAQVRFINKPHPWQTNQVEGGIGYQLYPNKSIWLGYRWRGDNPNNDFYMIHTIFERLNITIKDDTLNRIDSRTQLEETRRSNQAELSYVLRERLTLELIKRFAGNINPVLFDEVFFQLNNTNFTSHQFIRENRLFLGVNLYTSTNSFWQMGYMNQYQFAPPTEKVNAMNHILFFNYNLI